MTLESTVPARILGIKSAAGSVIKGTQEYTLDYPLDERNHVYHGQNESGDAVVVKSYCDNAGLGDIQRGKFARETNVQRILATQPPHQNLLHCIDVIDDDQGRFVVYPFLEGDTIDELFERLGKLMPQDVLPLLRGVCDGLDRLHIEGIVHRDVKPQNVMVSYSGDHPHPDREALRYEADEISTTLFDFDISLHPHTRHLDQKGRILGTFRLMAPEIWNWQEASRASDIYALGITLYRAFTGEYPFSSSDTLELSRQHNGLPMPDPRNRNKKLPLDAVLILEKALEKDPANRYQFAYELLTDLEAVL